MNVTKQTIDQAAVLKLEVERLDKELKAAKTRYAKALAPITEYVDKQVPVSKGVQVTGARYQIEFGKCRETRKVVDQVLALLALEKVEKGLGYASMTIKIKALDDNLRATEVDSLTEKEIGARSTKVVKLR